MTELIDEKGRLAMPAHFRPGEAVEVEVEGNDRLVVRRVQANASAKIELVTLPDGSTEIQGLPKMESDDVKRLLEDFP